MLRSQFTGFSDRQSPFTVNKTMQSQFTVNCLFTDHKQLKMSITNHKELKMPITCHENKYIYPTIFRVSKQSRFSPQNINLELSTFNHILWNLDLVSEFFDCRREGHGIFLIF